MCFFFQAEDGIRDTSVTGVQTCALPISRDGRRVGSEPIFVTCGPCVEFFVLSRQLCFCWPWSARAAPGASRLRDRKSTRLNSSHRCISYAVFCLKKKTNIRYIIVI